MRSGAGWAASYPGGTVTVAGRSPPTTTVAAFDEDGEADATATEGRGTGVASTEAAPVTDGDGAVVADPFEHATSNVVVRARSGGRLIRSYGEPAVNGGSHELVKGPDAGQSDRKYREQDAVDRECRLRPDGVRRCAEADEAGQPEADREEPDAHG